ncbi:hypothetical protein NEICINOT_05138 [Neisseria cinerea ATCC 14685]|uniref:Uncharacterized protein n=1 Tax=Neisseria cinerea ATCC 14685 TaxID=546262 RepID=D0W612_NEICI|nr:hypothetical protein NEICINOT_05138 [Neisseria cinerea ATCC 14685]
MSTISEPKKCRLNIQTAPHILTKLRNDTGSIGGSITCTC